MSAIKPEIDLGNHQLRNRVLLTLSLVIFLSCLATGLQNLFTNKVITQWVAVSQFIFSSFFAYTSVSLFRGKKKSWFNWAIVYTYIGLILFAVSTFGIDKSVVMWLYSVPVVSYFILSRFHGFFVSTLVLTIIIYMRIDYNLYEAGKAWNSTLINHIFPYVVIIAMANVYEKVRIQNEWELSEYALTDPLTGCYNRLALKSIYSTLKTAHQNTSLLLIDIDYFKRVNDLYGHEAGDKVLKALSTLFVEALSEKQVFRIGGEEFLLILNGDAREAKTQAETLRSKVQNLNFCYDEKPIHLTFSGGFKRLAVDDVLSDTLKEVDLALYDAKSKGRNQISYV